MLMCNAHWNACIDAIRDRDLWHLVDLSNIKAVRSAFDGSTKTLKFVSESLKKESSDNVDGFDPLEYLVVAISSSALICGGHYLLTGEYCPLCEGESHGNIIGQTWINEAGDLIYKFCQRNNLQG